MRMSGVRPLKNYCPPTPVPSVLSATPRKLKSFKFLLPDGKEPFKLEQKVEVLHCACMCVCMYSYQNELPVVSS